MYERGIVNKLKGNRSNRGRGREGKTVDHRGRD